jgi:hypothetical protein
VGDLSSKLSNWYFPECGGLLLTPQARDFYFALQDLLRATSRVPEEWDADRSKESEGDQKLIFRAVLTARSADEAVSVLDYFSTGAFEDWQNEATDLGKKWREGIKDVAAAWNELDEGQRFMTLQQVGSILRTSLVDELRSASAALERHHLAGASWPSLCADTLWPQGGLVLHPTAGPRFSTGFRHLGSR